MSDNPEAQRRKYFRLPYPAAARPPFHPSDGSAPYRVLEIAENSMLIEQKPDELLQKGDPVMGELVFHDSVIEKVAGEVFRHDARGVVVMLSAGISLRHVIKEQVYLRSQYPLFFRKNKSL